MDQNTEMRLEDAGTGSGVRFREFRPGDDATIATSGEPYAIVDEQTGELLGGIGAAHEDTRRRSAEVTFRVLPRARRRGVATTALREFGRHALAGRLDRLELLIPWDNPAAQRVALSAGYTREGVRRGAPELIVYSRLAGDPEEPAPRLLPDLPGGELSDGVIILRPLGPADVDFHTELQNLPEVVNTSVPPVPPSPAVIHERCFHSEAHWLAGTRAELVIVEEATGIPAGEISLYYQEPPTAQAMIGYSVLPAYRGRGFAPRAAQLVALWVFAETDIARLIAGTLPTNTGSQRVLEKAGFTREAYLRSRLPGPDGARLDDVQYVLLAGDLLVQVSGAESSHA
ncbi:GNAT family N-acetyltransferase [Actinoplanes sp. NEAU-A12]|uniref:GNAT family N-acetyltransferase n=1 Tax=Actinoplanes sandaracinus TaxID=3045177 RepID=A0ABT6WEY9_9ACTN|nr:GNAT family N-acetyltransferase [Actinoplanes sandaracinus]MDI6098306.1 GNAT family N-acetyltransferase [Actinoplanes sandaracinus]